MKDRLVSRTGRKLLTGSSGSLPRRLLVFTRYPEPGRAKTRLIPALGEKAAAELHMHMAEYTLLRARTFMQDRSAGVEVRYEGGNREKMECWLGEDLIHAPQGEGDLGNRMERALNEALQNGMDRVVIVGTDCPGLTTDHLRDAFFRLDTRDLVLGPAKDGGYYLIGIKGKVHSGLFRGIPWGTDRVLKRTREKAESLNLSIGLMETLHDVDRPEDIVFWRRELERQGLPSTPLHLSIIVPACNEAGSVEAALESTQGAPGTIERIVVDGGSRDETIKRAKARGARVIFSPPGKAKQMNAGARAARGEGLVFLHADTRLPRGFGYHIREILSRPGTVAGAFRLRIQGAFTGLRLIEGLANFRSVRMDMPYGDQAIFLKADRFRRINGFPEMPFMEDFELMRLLRRQGRIGIAPVAAVTSDRRYRELGILRTTGVNQLIIAAYWAGVSPDRLATWYRTGLKKQGARGDSARSVETLKDSDHGLSARWKEPR